MYKYIYIYMCDTPPRALKRQAGRRIVTSLTVQYIYIYIHILMYREREIHTHYSTIHYSTIHYNTLHHNTLHYDTFKPYSTNTL